jgi:hypothetical protein
MVIPQPCYYTINLSSLKHGDMFIWKDGKETRILMSSHIEMKEFKVKSKISMYYMINSNNTNTKHEFKVKYEGY